MSVLMGRHSNYHKEHEVTNEIVSIGGDRDNVSRYSQAEIMKRINDFVEWAWRDVVCTCYVPSDDFVRNANGHHMCTNKGCGKLRRWMYHLCPNCHKGHVNVGTAHPERQGPFVHWCDSCMLKKFGPGEGEPLYKPREMRETSEIFNEEFNFDSFDL